MKLTEARLNNLNEDNIPNAGLSKEEIQQILKNQEMLEITPDLVEFERLQRLEDRLKKRIQEVRNDFNVNNPEHMTLGIFGMELQKILGEKK